MKHMAQTLSHPKSTSGRSDTGWEASPAVLDHLWPYKKVQQHFNDALHKRKGNCEAPDCYRGIFLLSIAGKTLAILLLNHANMHLEKCLLLQSQCGVRKVGGTIDMVFSARQLRKKCQEQNVDLCLHYVGLITRSSNARRAKGSAAFDRLQANVWNRRDITLSNLSPSCKCYLYRQMVSVCRI